VRSEPMNSTVVDLVPLLETHVAEDFGVVEHLRSLRTVVFEPPAALLPTITGALDDASSPVRFRAIGKGRWVAYAGGIAAGAAGALVLASRNRKHLVG
jgi:hypothetical protein